MDTSREWLEVSGPSVDVAVQVALDELGLDSPDQVNVEVIQEGKKGVLGLGGREAIVKVTRVSKKRRRRRRRKSSSGDGDSSNSSGSPQARKDDQQSSRSKSAGRSGGSKAGAGQAKSSGAKGGGRSRKRGNERGNGSRSAKQSNDRASADTKKEATMPNADISEQAQVASEFLEGLLEAFGLEGTVSSRIDDDVLYLDVEGAQTEALVGSKGSIMTSVLEITRTVVQRKTFGAPRMRLDIAGYAERRRTALTIYAGKLADRVKEDGNEVMLEPMNPADRKVVHDAVADIEGVRSFSEGEDPQRAVVIAPD
jgi:spoIIIJ-associated protein